jgi:hypothetical protein
MKRLLTACSLVLSAGLALAQTPTAPATPTTPPVAAPATPTTSPAKTTQQQKMAHCNDQAAGKSGDERQAFMKQCLSAKKASQTDKMRACNAQAKGMKGEERKTFMKSCLSA